MLSAEDKQQIEREVHELRRQTTAHCAAIRHGLRCDTKMVAGSIDLLASARQTLRRGDELLANVRSLVCDEAGTTALIRTPAEAQPAVPNPDQWPQEPPRDRRTLP